MPEICTDAAPVAALRFERVVDGRWERVCLQCGATYYAKRAHSEVCSGRCRALRSKAKMVSEAIAEAFRQHFRARAQKAAATRARRKLEALSRG